MAKKQAETTTTTASKANSGSHDEIDDLTAALIKDINKEFGMRVAYNLAETEAPAVVKRWIDTGSIQLNYAIRNAPQGGYPEGRIIEIAGPPSIGKSHLAYHAAAVVQAMGGIVVYIDTENATPIQKLAQMGINIKKGFVYMDIHATEHVFKALEETILKAKSLMGVKDVPVLAIWDSVAATSPLAELNGEYDDNTVGMQARVISKGMRKITGIIGQNNVTLLCLNQLRDAIGVMHGDTQVTPGGKAIPFHASVRVRLSSGTQVRDPKTGNVIGIHVIATIKKNKVGPPFRKYEFDIIFGKGIVEHEYIFDEVRAYCEKNKVIFEHKDADGKTRILNANISGTSAWRTLTVNDETTGEILIEKKFNRSNFNEIMADPAYKVFVDKIIEAAYTYDVGQDGYTHVGDTPDSDEGEHAEEQ